MSVQRHAGGTLRRDNSRLGTVLRSFRLQIATTNGNNDDANDSDDC